MMARKGTVLKEMSCRTESGHGISESEMAIEGGGVWGEEQMAKPRRRNAEKRYQIVKEALSQKEPMGQIARRHQVSERVDLSVPDKFFEGGKRL